ncbi:MAG: DUF1353 domain-containing protein [Pseudomonadota bacterium]
MTEDEIKMAVAAEMGGDVAAAMDPAKEQERAFGQTEAFMVASLIGQAVQIAISIWQTRQAAAQRVEAIATNDKLQIIHPELDPEKRAEVIARILAKMDPTQFGEDAPQTPLTRARATPTLTDEENGARLDMIRGLLEAEDRKNVVRSFDMVTTRDFGGGVPRLIPFADQYWWISTVPMKWTPAADGSDGANAVLTEVPENFVCDMASVPRFLWTLYPKTGRYGLAAIYHDWLCWDQARTRLEADDTFFAIMKDMDVSMKDRNAIYWGVRIFGGSYWRGNTAAKEAGEKRVLKRLPTDPRITWEQWKAEPDVFV